MTEKWQRRDLHKVFILEKCLGDRYLLINIRDSYEGRSMGRVQRGAHPPLTGSATF